METLNLSFFRQIYKNVLALHVIFGIFFIENELYIR